MAKRAAIDTWIVPVADGWDPRMDPLTGRVACGNQTLSLVDPRARTVQAVASTPARLLRWLSPERLVWQRSTGPDTAELWSAPAYDLAAVSIAALDPHTVCGNTFAASTGRWASWLSKGLRLSVGTLTTATPLLVSVYECQMAGDWLVTSRDAGGMAIVWLQWGGADWIVVSESAALATYPQFWANPSGLVGVGYFGPCGVIAPGEAQATDVTCTPWKTEGIPRVIEVEEVPYVVTASYTPENVPVLYARTLEAARDPARRTQEIATIALPFGFTQFDGRGEGDRLELAGCDDAGHLAWLSVAIAALPVGPLGPPDPEPPDPPDPPDPPVTAAPKVTITGYDDLGTAPMLCTATWATEAGSGPVDVVRWLFSTDTRLWTIDATNPATDPDHTFHFTTPGTYYLRLEATGPGGTATTGAERKVTVMAETPPPTPMLDTSAFRLASGYLLCADQHDGNVVNATRQGEPAAWESFLVEPHPAGGLWVALKADTGYVCADRQTGQVIANRPTPGAWEAFRVIDYAPDKAALMTSDGGYLWAESGGGGKVNLGGTRIDDFSTFAVIAGIQKEKPAEPEEIVPAAGKATREQALDLRCAFLEAPGFEWAFMFPGWSEDKQRRYLDWMDAHGHTHLPFAAWGSYPNSGSADFDFRSDSQWPKFLALLDTVIARGKIPMFFCHTDHVGGGSPFSEDDLRAWLRKRIPDLLPRVRMYVSGWEFNQIDSGWDHYWCWSGDALIRHLKLLRELVGPDNLVFSHWSPERITGWPDWGHTDTDTRGEPDWWYAVGTACDGILYQRPPDEEEKYSVAHTIGGTSSDGSHDIGDANRLAGQRTWGVNHTYFLCFEYSRDCGRSERLSKQFAASPAPTGKGGNMGNWNGN